MTGPEAPRPQSPPAYRARVLSLLASWPGLGGSPAVGDRRYSDYRALIATGETDAAAHDMARASGCALVVRGYWRLILARPPACLLAPYVTGRALADVAEAARHAGAVRAPGHRPEPGDVVHVGPAAGAVEHVYIVTAVDPQPNPYGGWDVDSIDGGQRDAAGWECIRARERVVVPSEDCAAWWDDEVGGPNRPVTAVYSLAAMVAAFGVNEDLLPDP